MSGSDDDVAALRAELATARAAEASANTRAAEASARAAEEGSARVAAEAARSAAEAARAAEEAARVAADMRSADLTARLEQLSVGGGDAAAASAAPPRSRTVPASFAIKRDELLSPTVASKSFLDNRFVALIGAPVSVTGDADSAAAFSRLLVKCGSARAMMQEQACYKFATAHLPAFAERVLGAEGDVSAVTLFTPAAMRTAAWGFARACKPELHARASVGDGEGRVAFRPAFNGELKTAGDCRALEQAAYYTAMDMVRVFFPDDPDPLFPDDPGAASARRFFARPPLGFALVGFPYVAHFIALEFVGRLLVSPMSAPFILDSAAHMAAAAALPDARYDAPVLLPEALDWRTPEDAALCNRVAWSVDAHGVFRKIVRGDARSGAGFADMHRAYAKLAGVLGTAPAHLHLPHYARMRYGAHAVLVEMPAVADGGREAGDELVTHAGSVLAAAAASIVWLARKGVVYVDLRGPNVLLDGEGHAWLVDFDDCLAVDEPVTTLAAYTDVLAARRAAPAAVESNSFAARFVGGHLPDVQLALKSAFDAQQDEN